LGKNDKGIYLTIDKLFSLTTIIVMTCSKYLVKVVMRLSNMGATT